MAKMLLPLLGLGALVAYVATRGDTAEPAPEEESAPDTSGLTPGLAAEVQAAIASGDVERMRAALAKVQAAGETEVSAWLAELISQYEADQARGTALQAAWSEPASAGWTPPDLSPLSDDQLDDLYGVLVGSNPVGAGGAYLDLMAELENAGLGEQARWLEHLGQENGALPPAGTPPDPQPYAEMMTGLLGLPGGPAVHAMVVSAIASGDPRKLAEAAIWARKVGAEDLGDYLDGLAEQAHTEEREKEDREENWKALPTPPTGLPAPPLSQLPPALYDRVLSYVADSIARVPGTSARAPELAAELYTAGFPAHAVWVGWFETHRGSP